MRKIIAAFNITIDGFCDHTAVDPDEDIHRHYAALLDGAGVLLYGRITFGLMQYWQELLNKPSGEKSMDDFATSIDRVPKIVFSNTLKETCWASATLADDSLENTLTALKAEEGRDIFIGGRSLIVQAANLDLIDEFQLYVHPVLAGKGLLLFDGMKDRKVLTLMSTKTFRGGTVIHYYSRWEANAG